MPRYTGHANAATGTNKTILTLFQPAASPAHRLRLYEIILGCAATPADQAALFFLGRFTAVGTEGSGFSPVPLDAADVASIADCGCGAFSVEPTYTSGLQLLTFALNQRATFRFVSAPGGEIVLPATQSNGAGMYSSTSTSTQATECYFGWAE